MTKSALLAVSLSALSLAVIFAPSLAQEDLSRCQGKNRVLLIFAPSKSDPRWQKQNALLKNSAAAFRNRNLLRFDVIGNGKSSSKLRLRYGVNSDGFVYLLIGKDGYVASSDSTPISLSKLMAQIDRMPMRREEMRRRGR